MTAILGYARVSTTGQDLDAQVSNHLGVCSAPTGPAEFPQLAGGSVIVVNRLVDGVGVDPAMYSTRSANRAS